jgi:hypothetical protein
VIGNIFFRSKISDSHVELFIRALLYPSFRGFGPANPSFHKLLEKWSKITGPLSRRAKALNDAKFLGCGATIRHSSMEGFKRLEKYYKVGIFLCLSCVFDT